MQSEKELSVSVTYGETKVEFSGSPEVVMRSLHEFIAKVIPNIDLARSISINYSLNDLVQIFKDYIRITPEGPRVWKDDKKLSDKEIILLQLVAARVANLSGKSQTDTMSANEIEAVTGLYPKTVSSRLSELTKLALVERITEEGSGRYKITTIGINKLNEQLTKKFK